MSTPEWLYVGARVVTLRDDWRTRAQRPEFAEVVRVGKRDVVLDNGERFNVNHLTRRDGGTWGWNAKLLAADDPVAISALETWRYAQLVNRGKVACENYRFGKDGTSAVDVILALAPLTGVSDEIAALFARGGEDADQ